MEKFINFINNWHDSLEFEFPPNSAEYMELCRELSEVYATTISENLFVEKQYTGRGIGVSQLGRPAIITAWEYFFPNSRNVSKPSWAKKRKWLGGHVFEIWCMYILRRMGYTVSYQQSVSVSPEIPNGHPDFICISPEGVKFIVECKHVNPSNYKEFARKGMSSDRYRTQLSLYCQAEECLGVWLIGNTDTGECMAIPYDATAYHMDAMLRTRAMLIANCIVNAEAFWQVLERIAPPEPRRLRDGRNAPIPEMYVAKGVLHEACCLYNLEYTPDGKPNILGYNYPNQAKQWEPQL